MANPERRSATAYVTSLHVLPSPSNITQDIV